MRIYRIAQASYSVSKEELSDRTRYYLVDPNGRTENQEGEPIGRLVVQSNMDPNNYMLTGFKIDDPEQRGQKLGSLLMREFLADPKWMDKPVMVEPLPYVGDDPEYIEYLRSLYRHFGFEDYSGSYMILRRRK